MWNQWMVTISTIMCKPDILGMPLALKSALLIPHLTCTNRLVGQPLLGCSCVGVGLCKVSLIICHHAWTCTVVHYCWHVSTALLALHTLPYWYTSQCTYAGTGRLSTLPMVSTCTASQVGQQVPTVCPTQMAGLSTCMCLATKTRGQLHTAQGSGCHLHSPYRSPANPLQAQTLPALNHLVHPLQAPNPQAQPL